MAQRKPKFDPKAPEVTPLLQISAIPQKAPVVKEKLRYKKPKAEDPDDYGRGILELYDYSNRLRGDWMRVYQELSPNKRLGVDAHLAYLRIFPALRRELNHSSPTYEQDYLRLYQEREATWKRQWGHIPGWWNWDFPRKKKNGG